MAYRAGNPGDGGQWLDSGYEEDVLSMGFPNRLRAESKMTPGGLSI